MADQGKVKIGERLSHAEAMALAVREAQGGWGRVSPNPLVGAVILDAKSRLLASGFHASLGGDHAEIAALKSICDSSQLVGGAIYVTLEPCAHHGRTPPCAEALAKTGLANVYFGVVDPNPLVSGKGKKLLEEASKNVVLLEDQASECEECAEFFLYSVRNRRPFLTLKSATSLDGQMALKSGESQWITGPEARLEAHRWRAGHDAILIGVETFLRDDPQLTVRHPDYLWKKNRILVLDRKGRGLERLQASRLLKSHHPSQIIWVVGEGIAKVASSAAREITIWSAREKDGGLDLGFVLDLAYQNGIQSILAEGGPRLTSAFLRDGLAQRWLQFIAPSILGAGNERAVTSQFSVSTMSARVDLLHPRTAFFGRDLLWTGWLS